MGEDGPANPVGASFVVNDGLGAEFRQPEKTGTAEEGISHCPFFSAGDVGHEWKPGEVVAGKEAFGGEVPVGIEVGVHGRPALQKKVLLGVRFVIP
jgi:hypothetical protein